MKLILPNFNYEIDKINKSISAHKKKCAEISKEVNKWGKANKTQVKFLEKFQ